MLNTFTYAEPGQIEANLVEIAKGALPPTREEWKRLDELRGRRRYELIEAERGELSALSAKAERLLLTPQEILAEETLFAKYGPTSGTDAPRRAITTKQSIVEKALAAAHYAHGRGLEQPFTERAGKTVGLEEHERPKGRGVGDEFEKAQELGGSDTIGLGDGFRRGREAPDGRLELLGVFPGYLGRSVWVFWDAIREFDAAQRKPNDPDPLGAVIWNIATRRTRHSLSSLPHGFVRYGSRPIKDDRSKRELQLEVMESAFSDTMAKADAAVKTFLQITSNATDAAVLRIWWPLPVNGERPASIPPAEIARQLNVNRSVISRRLVRIRRQIGDVNHALDVWEMIDAYGRGRIDWYGLATNETLAGIINRGDVVPPLVRLERRHTGVFTGPAHDPFYQCKRKVPLKNGNFGSWTCQQDAPPGRASLINSGWSYEPNPALVRHDERFVERLGALLIGNRLIRRKEPAIDPLSDLDLLRRCVAITAPPLQPPEIVDQGSTRACNVTSETEQSK